MVKYDTLTKGKNIKNLTVMYLKHFVSPNAFKHQTGISGAANPCGSQSLRWE